jgi:serralysin
MVEEIGMIEAHLLGAESSGNIEIDALVRGEGRKWGEPYEFGSPVTVTFSFLTTATQSPSLMDNSYGDPDTFQPYNSNMVLATKDALDEWAAAANITFVEVESGGDIQFGSLSLPGPLGGFSSGVRADAYVILDNTEIRYTNPTEENGGHITYLHEIGHTLGLKHPASYEDHDALPFLPTEFATTYCTIMAYPNPPGVSWGEVSRLGEFDVQAIQYLYGVSTFQSSGTGLETGENFTGTVFRNYFDARGGDDFLALGGGADHALGGSGNDVIYGNSGGDVICGNLGQDSIFGGRGSDAIYGGKQADLIYGNNSADAIYGNLEDDKVYGGQGFDQIYGGQGSDQIYGNRGSDDLYGNKGDDVLRGDAGSDLLSGGDGDDTLFGGIETDFYFGGLGADVFVFDDIHEMPASEDFVFDFDPNVDQIAILNAGTYGITSSEQVYERLWSHAYENGYEYFDQYENFAWFNINGHNFVLLGTNIEDLSPDNFLIW